MEWYFKAMFIQRVWQFPREKRIFWPVFSCTRNISCLSLQKAPQLDKEQSFFFFVRRAKRARDGNEKRETASLCTDPPSLPSGKIGEIEFSRGEEGVCTRAKRLFAVYAVIEKKQTNKNQSVVFRVNFEMLMYFPVFVTGKLGRISACVLKD